MDEFEFHPSNWTPGNTTLDNPNYYEFMDLIERKYDDTDFRTAEEKKVDEQQEAIWSGDNQSQLGPEAFTTNSQEKTLPSGMESPFAEGKNPYELAPPVTQQPQYNFSEKEERFIRSRLPLIPEEDEINDPKNFSGEHNLDQVLWQVNQIKSNPALLERYDRDGDGEYTIFDRYDLSRISGSLRPEQKQLINDRWLHGLENKTFNARMDGWNKQSMAEGPLGAFPQLPGQMPGILIPFWAQDTNMSRYMYRRRKHALTPKGEGDPSSGIRQNIIGPALEFSKNTLATPERLFSVATGGDFIGANTPVTDFIFNDKNPMSANSMYMDPVQRTWGDGLIHEATYFGLGAALTYFTLGKGAPLMLTRGANAVGASTKLGAAMNATAGGMKWVFGGGAIGNQMTRKGVRGLLQKAPMNFTTGFAETFPPAFFRQRLESGLDGIEDEFQWPSRFAKLYPKSRAFSRQIHAGFESPLMKQFSYSFGTATVDGGFSAALMAGFGGLGLLGKRLGIWSPTNAAQLKTSTSTFDSTHYTQPVRDGKYYHDQHLQKTNDIQEAAETELSLFDDGPGNPYYNPDNTAAQDFSTYGPHKNGQEMPGQGNVPDRTTVRQVSNDLDEIDGQVTIEGGSTGQLMTPVQLRSFERFGVDDGYRKGLVESLINDPVFKAQINALPKDKRTLGNLSPGTLQRLQELDGRDAASMDPGEYWGKLFMDQPLSTIIDGKELSTFTLENLQIADALNRSLLIRVRDLAAGTTEMVRKTDIFAAHGPLRNALDNLTVGLSEAKRTRYSWGLIREVLNEKGGKLSGDDIVHINDQVARRSEQINKETRDGIRLMMRMLENNDSHNLAEGLLEAFQMSNKIHNWKDFDAWMRSKIRGGEFDGKVHTGAMTRELQTVMVNSILSGPKTPLRAILGTTTNAYYNAFNEAAGALVRAPFTDNLIQRRVAFAKLHGMINLIPDAYKLFRANLDSKFSGDFANIRTRYSEAPTRNDIDWELGKEWTERNGTDGDKAALYMTDNARTMNNNKLLGWSPRTMAAIDDTFKWLLAKTRSKEMGLRKVLDELGDTSAEITPEIMKRAEDLEYNSLLDIDGNIDLRRDAWLKKQFEEITLTSELKGFAGALDKVLNDFPLMKPFYLFARTGINGLNLSLKNTPGIALLHKETIDILSHSSDDFSKLSRYGITNANDLANAKSLITGRQAVGSAVVSMMGMKYMSGQLTGNGPADKQLKQNWINSGWKPNHIYFGDVGFDYSSLEPFNMIFSAISDIGDNIELMGSEWAEKRFQAVAFVLGRGLTSKTYMSGLDNMMQLVQMKPWAWSKTAANVLNNSIPLAGMRNELGKFVNPHMKELNSDIWSSLRNRNLAFEYGPGKDLPEKSDLLNGKPINNWNFVGRAFNAVSPIQIDYRSSSPGRKLLLNSNYDLKSTTYSYKGYSFVNNARVRAHFQNAIGNASITYKGKTFENLEKALDHASTLPEIENSMAQMRANINNPANWDINPNTYPHNTVINRLVSQAREKAWAAINNPSHPGYLELQEVKSKKDGLSSRTRDNREKILDLSFSDKQIDLFPKN